MTLAYAPHSAPSVRELASYPWGTARRKPKASLMLKRYWNEFPEVLSAADLARIFRKTESTVWVWLKAGKIPGHLIDGSWIVYRSEIACWIESDAKPQRRPLLPVEMLGRLPDELTVTHLAALFGRSEQTIYGWLVAKRIPGHKIANTWLVFKDEIVGLLEKTANISGSAE